MRQFLLKRQRRIARLQRSQLNLVNDSSYTRTVSYLNSANNSNSPANTNQTTTNTSTESRASTDQREIDRELIFGSLHMPPRGTTDLSRWDDEIAASSKWMNFEKINLFQRNNLKGIKKRNTDNKLLIFKEKLSSKLFKDESSKLFKDESRIQIPPICQLD